MDGYIVNFVNDFVHVIVKGINVAALVGGGYYAAIGVFHLYERAQFKNDMSLRAIFGQLAVSALLLGFSSFMRANGGVQPGQTGYAVLAFQTGGLTGEAASSANAVLQAVMSLLEAMGWLAQLRGALTLYDLGKGKSDATVWRAMGYIMGGGVLADMPNAVIALDRTLGTAIFS